MSIKASEAKASFPSPPDLSATNSWESKIRKYQNDIRKLMSGDTDLPPPYYNEMWKVKEGFAYTDSTKHMQTARVYYLPQYIDGMEIPQLISGVPMICTSGDRYIVTQDGKVQKNLATARTKFPFLITNEQRRRSRMKCIASSTKALGIKGYRSRLLALSPEDTFDCIVVTGAGPQFEADYLDFADLIVSKNNMRTRLECYSDLGPIPKTWEDIRTNKDDFIEINRAEDYVFHKAAYIKTMNESFYLWFKAFDDQVRLVDPEKKGIFQLCAIGCGFFADLPLHLSAGNIGRMLQPILVDCVVNVLENYRFPNIGAISFCDHSPNASFSPGRDVVQGIELIKAPKSDILEFNTTHKSKFILGLLNPSDCFALPGNEFNYGSVESEIG
jgi:hypothetical protein